MFDGTFRCESVLSVWCFLEYRWLKYEAGVSFFYIGMKVDIILVFVGVYVYARVYVCVGDCVGNFLFDHMERKL